MQSGPCGSAQPTEEWVGLLYAVGGDSALRRSNGATLLWGLAETLPRGKTGCSRTKPTSLRTAMKQPGRHYYSGRTPNVSFPKVLLQKAAPRGTFSPDARNFIRKVQRGPGSSTHASTVPPDLGHSKWTIGRGTPHHPSAGSKADAGDDGVVVDGIDIAVGSSRDPGATCLDAISGRMAR
jgi:hypothetical protein